MGVAVGMRLAVHSSLSEIALYIDVCMYVCIYVSMYVVTMQVSMLVLILMHLLRGSPSSGELG